MGWIVPATDSWVQRLIASLAIYADRRIILIALMGVASGLPLLLTLSTLSYWLRTQGLDLGAIGLFAAVGIPYSLKFLWAPLIDRLPVPILTCLPVRPEWLDRRARVGRGGRGPRIDAVLRAG